MPKTYTPGSLGGGEWTDAIRPEHGTVERAGTSLQGFALSGRRLWPRPCGYLAAALMQTERRFLTPLRCVRNDRDAEARAPAIEWEEPIE